MLSVGRMHALEETSLNKEDDHMRKFTEILPLLSLFVGESEASDKGYVTVVILIQW